MLNKRTKIKLSVLANLWTFQGKNYSKPLEWRVWENVTISEFYENLVKKIITEANESYLTYINELLDKIIATNDEKYIKKTIQITVKSIDIVKETSADYESLLPLCLVVGLVHDIGLYFIENESYPHETNSIYVLKEILGDSAEFRILFKAVSDHHRNPVKLKSHIISFALASAVNELQISDNFKINGNSKKTLDSVIKNGFGKGVFSYDDNRLFISHEYLTRNIKDSCSDTIYREINEFYSGIKVKIKMFFLGNDKTKKLWGYLIQSNTSESFMNMSSNEHNSHLIKKTILLKEEPKQ